MSTTFVQTGLPELKQMIEEFPDDQAEALRATALVTADRVLKTERQLLLQQTHGEGNTAAALKIVEHPENHVVSVLFGPIKDRPQNLPFWIEFGTIHQSARPFIRPAADAERERNTREMATAAEKSARQTFKD